MRTAVRTDVAVMSERTKRVFSFAARFLKILSLCVFVRVKALNVFY